MYTNNDQVMDSFGVQLVFIESGKYHIRDKIEEIYGDENPYDGLPKFWCELSWGSGTQSEFDAAVNAFGNTLDEAIQNCLDYFLELVQKEAQPYAQIAKRFNIKVINNDSSKLSAFRRNDSGAGG